MNNSVSLLPTARVQVQCKDGRWRPKTLLFDSGADRSYVTKSLVKEVSPKFIRSTTVPLPLSAVVLRALGQESWRFVLRQWFLTCVRSNPRGSMNQFRGFGSG